MIDITSSIAQTAAQGTKTLGEIGEAYNQGQIAKAQVGQYKQQSAINELLLQKQQWDLDMDKIKPFLTSLASVQQMAIQKKDPSLVSSYFDSMMSKNPEIRELYTKYVGDPNTMKVILTTNDNLGVKFDGIETVVTPENQESISKSLGGRKVSIGTTLYASSDGTSVTYSTTSKKRDEDLKATTDIQKANIQAAAELKKLSVKMENGENLTNSERLRFGELVALISKNSYMQIPEATKAATDITGLSIPGLGTPQKPSVPAFNFNLKNNIQPKKK
jgi:hypothetical protein